MKVCILTSGYPRHKNDFDSIYIHELAKNLTTFNNEVHVLTPHYPNCKVEEELDDVNVHRFPYFYPKKYQKLCYGGGILYNFKNSYLAKIQVPLFFLSELFYTIKMIKKEKIDVVHSHWLVPQGLVGGICKKIFGIPHVTTVHGSDVNIIKKSKILSRICSFILHNSDRITANSSYTKDRVLSIDSRAKDKVEVIPMGVDINRFGFEDDTNLKEVFGAEYLILSIGRLIDWKGTKYLIISMKEVIKKFPNSKLVIGGDGPEKRKLEKLTKKLNLKKNVIFTGYIKNSDLSKYYDSSDIFVLASMNLNGLTEALGVVLLEAMVCGTPVIGSNVGGIPDIIKDGYNGFLVPEKSPKDLADKIIELLSNKELAKEFSVNGLKTVRERFSWEIVSERFMRMYEVVKNGKVR